MRGSERAPPPLAAAALRGDSWGGRRMSEAESAAVIMGEGLGFGVWGLGFGFWGLGFGVWGLGFGVTSNAGMASS